MTIRRAAGFLFGLPIVLGIGVGLALAGDSSTTVSKTPLTTGSVGEEGTPEDALRPSIGQDVVPAGSAAPVGEITPTAIDEGASWEAAVEAANAPTPLIGEEQAEAVKRINAYFNSITNLQGGFEQIDPNNKRSTGRFYVQRPGKIRFDYAPPSALRIVADGHSLAIEDSDLKTVEKYPIKSTPFRLLLTESVDLDRDARIVGVERDQGGLAISLEDKDGDAAGRIKLYFESSSDLELKEWLITDAQGLTTRVTINNMVSGRKVAADFFQSKDSFSPFR
ncbi:MAG: LolA family protein [Methyloceanibacter sp.]|uniref:LolA family protein n=1 Tax=Methyloceanibacter sp. TaxID=1965321 RepID=UPI003D6CAE82